MKSHIYFLKNFKSKIPVLLVLGILQALTDALGISLFIPVIMGDSKSLNQLLIEKLSIDIGDTLSQNTIFLVIILLFIFKACINYSIHHFQSLLQEKHVIKVRRRILKHIFSMNHSEFIEKGVGEWNNFFMVETERLSMGIKDYFVSINLIIITFGYLLLSLLNSPGFTVVIILLSAIFFSAYRFLYNKTRGVSRGISSETGDFNSLLSQILNNLLYVKLTDSENLITNKFEEKISDIFSKKRRMFILNGISRVLREPVLILVLVCAVFINNKYLGVEISTLGVSLVLIYRGINSLTLFQSNYTRFLSQYGAIENIELELIRNESIKDSRYFFDNIDEKLVEISGLQIKSGEEILLSDIDLSINKGDMIVVTGSSGSGKTSLLYAIAGVKRTNKGRIEINSGIKVGFVSQESFLFDDTLYNNVTKWTPKSTESLRKFHEVMNIAKMTDYLEEHGGDVDFWIEQGGSNLSGGQRQRLCLARELYGEPELLILDEITAGLDVKLERALYRNLESMLPELTILSVAHRQTAINLHRKIYFIENRQLLLRESRSTFYS